MATTSQLVGHTISRYRVIEKLGAGVMGVVYKPKVSSSICTYDNSKFGAGFELNSKKVSIPNRLKSVETFSGVFALPIPRG